MQEDVPSPVPAQGAAAAEAVESSRQQIAHRKEQELQLQFEDAVNSKGAEESRKKAARTTSQLIPKLGIKSI